MGCNLRLNINYPEFRRYHHTCILHGYANVMYVSLPAEDQIRCVFDDN